MTLSRDKSKNTENKELFIMELVEDSEFFGIFKSM